MSQLRLRKVFFFFGSTSDATGQEEWGQDFITGPPVTVTERASLIPREKHRDTGRRRHRKGEGGGVRTEGWGGTRAGGESGPLGGSGRIK